jgi:hypothetical protein
MLTGGLGNQMFQYAFGKRLAEKNNRPLYLVDQRLKDRATPRDYWLKVFNIDAPIITLETIHQSYEFFVRIHQ